MLGYLIEHIYLELFLDKVSIYQLSCISRTFYEMISSRMDIYMKLFYGIKMNDVNFNALLNGIIIKNNTIMENNHFQNQHYHYYLNDYDSYRTSETFWFCFRKFQYHNVLLYKSIDTNCYNAIQDTLYFEIQIRYSSNNSEFNCFSLGFCDFEEFDTIVEKRLMIGWIGLGWHSDDGHVLESNRIVDINETYGIGDRVGIGINFKNFTWFNTKNGELISINYIINRHRSDLMYPCVVTNGKYIYDSFYDKFIFDLTRLRSCL
jgi:hypothetical protein